MDKLSNLLGKKVFVVASSFLIIVTLLVVFLPGLFSEHYTFDKTSSISFATTTLSTEEVFEPSYVATPSSVKGIYMTSWIASSDKLRKPLVSLIGETELNSIVIDIKDYSGKVVFPVLDKKLKSFGSEEVRVRDMMEFIEGLHKKGIYTIGRVAVFQDAYFVKYRPDLAVKNKNGTAVWKDHKGISWIDPGSKEYWDYIVLISEVARKVGFDEINFDYIRFPSDGDLTDISYPFSSTTPKAEVLKSFFSYIHNKLKDSGLKISGDVFGMTTAALGDMGIGQLLENTFPYFDYVSPMVYPSHYILGYNGFKDPEAYPYEIIYSEMHKAVVRAEAASTTKNIFRPWLQSFGLRMDYGPKEVREQIKALNDLGLDSWLLWSPSNVYDKRALLSE